MKAKLTFIAAHAAQHSIRLMCRVLSVSPSWFPAWRVGAPKRAARHAVRDALAARIREIFEQSKRRYGAPRIHAELVAQGVRIARSWRGHKSVQWTDLPDNSGQDHETEWYPPATPSPAHPSHHRQQAQAWHRAEPAEA
ncbi:MAG: IS3 family transposase [Pseudomonadota bacterium]